MRELRGARMTLRGHSSPRKLRAGLGASIRANRRAGRLNETDSRQSTVILGVCQFGLLGCGASATLRGH